MCSNAFLGCTIYIKSCWIVNSETRFLQPSDPYCSFTSLAGDSNKSSPFTFTVARKCACDNDVIYLSSSWWAFWFFTTLNNSSAGLLLLTGGASPRRIPGRWMSRLEVLCLFIFIHPTGLQRLSWGSVGSGSAYQKLCTHHCHPLSSTSVVYWHFPNMGNHHIFLCPLPLGNL